MIHNATHDTTITYNKGMIHNATHDTTITYHKGMIHNDILMIQQLHTIQELFIMLYS